jgi:hypothetical protein
MIAPPVVEEIKRLLAEGRTSQRKIAKQLGVSRGTVNAIALGKRPERPPVPPDGEDELPPPDGPVMRCPTCGGLVHMPCLACRVRAIREESLARGRRGNGRRTVSSPSGRHSSPAAA